MGQKCAGRQGEQQRGNRTDEAVILGCAPLRLELPLLWMRIDPAQTQNKHSILVFSRMVSSCKDIQHIYISVCLNNTTIAGDVIELLPHKRKFLRNKTERQDSTSEREVCRKQ